MAEKEGSSDKSKSFTADDYFKNYGKEFVEIAPDQIMFTGYPKPVSSYRLVYETFQSSIEETYFWVLSHLRYDQGYPEVEKICDIFSASETSAFGGVAQQRLGIQQDKISQFLAVVGKMVKELFQLVRELRVLDERLGYYNLSKSPQFHIAEPAEVTLKGLFIDMAEGGSKNPASVYGMARELQFTTLPDLFFGTFPKTIDEVGPVVDRLEGFNLQVKNVLKRKLVSFLRWKDETFKELSSRRIFTVKYLRQHFDIINMYMSWIKPYLRSLRRLQSPESQIMSPDLISAFEGSMVEIEILAKKLAPKCNKYRCCQLVTFEYRTKPSMNYMAEGYNRGPLHVGEIKMTIRSYAWTDKDCKNYMKFREMEDLKLLGSLDASVQAAMESLGEDLEKYLAEAGETYDRYPKEEKKKPEKPKGPGLLEPFIAVAEGLREVLPIPEFKAKPKPTAADLGPFHDGIADPLAKKSEVSGAGKMAQGSAWVTYKIYKKAHRMITW